MTATWEIYVLKEPESGRVRYVGYSKNAKRRFTRHLQSARKEMCEYPVARWMRKLSSLGCLPVMEIIESGVGEWECREKYWIAHYRSKESDLLNVQNGGRGIPDSSRIAAGEKLKKRIFSDNHRRRISEAKIGVPRPDAAACAERFRQCAVENRGKKMNLSDAERTRRSQIAKENLNPSAMWAVMSADERARRSAMAREQMKRVWAERKSHVHAR